MKAFNILFEGGLCPPASLRPNILETNKREWEIADSFLRGAYGKVPKGSRMVMLPMTSRDPVTS